MYPLLTLTSFLPIYGHCNNLQAGIDLARDTEFRYLQVTEM